MAENMVICVGRQFGSGGHEIAQTLAKELNTRFYDKELLHEAARKSGILQELFEKHDEKPMNSLLFAPPAIDGKALSFADYVSYAPNDRIQDIVAQVIRDAAEEGPCVIIGRCADYILRGKPGVFSVFIHAELEKRIQRISRLHNLDEDAARGLIKKTDRNRANYYSFYTDREWDNINNYDIALNAGRLGTQKTVQLIKNAAPLYTT